MNFDLNKATAVLGGATGGPIDALGMGFGIPSCLVNMTKGALSLLPSSVLTGVGKTVEEARDSAGSAVNRAIKALTLELGIIEFDTERGVLKFVSGSSQYGIDENESKFLAGLDAIVGAAAFGAALWEIGQDIANQIEEIKECIGLLGSSQKFANGNSATLKSGVDFDASALPVDADYALNKAKLKSAAEFWNAANKQLGVIGGILSEREADPSLEPCFYESDIFSGVDDFCIVQPSSTEPTEQIFDLVYGPPKSKKGTFILTVDGLYYDYLNSDVYDISAIVPSDAIPLAGDRYKFEQDPNLGGRGTAISLRNLNKFFNTIFDEDSIDNSKEMEAFYLEDNFLQFIINQRNKQVDDLKRELEEVISAEGSDSALAINLKKSIAGHASKHLQKINKRKKQIEIAVKAPTYYGVGAVFSLGDDIPINDFTYLSSVNMPVALETQRKLVFNQGEVSGVVLPIQPKFVTSNVSQGAVAMDHLVVPLVGKGSIIAGSDYDETSGTFLSLTDRIETEGLEVIYNFLESNISTKHQSGKFAALNMAEHNRYGDGDFVGESPADVFPSGLGFPLLKGVNTFSAVGEVSSVGSYIAIPDIPEARNLAYNPLGFSVDFWVHIPELSNENSYLGWGDSGVSSLHKIVLACENSGGSYQYSNEDRMPPVMGTDSVRGLVVGFSRDRRITRDLDPSNDPADNAISDGLCFYVAPTQSVNTSGITFVNNTGPECPSGPGWHKCSVDTSTTVNGVSFADVETSAMHVNLSILPQENKVTIYLDGNEMATSSIDEVFGVLPYTSPNIPTFQQDGAFNYGTSGPSSDGYFTPWIIGGGFTDGNISSGGFMGQNSGHRSGLGGYLGSFKLYSKGLTQEEVVKNFEGQKEFFKNIDL